MTSERRAGAHDRVAPFAVETAPTEGLSGVVGLFAVKTAPGEILRAVTVFGAPVGAVSTASCSPAGQPIYRGLRDE